ncbi:MULTISPECIES: dTDP-4-dehydrorhamnose 3,5-epimerase family protein [Actinomadura]|uniref:dTDP-4-dehydrorhamnose 3,5-epimerase family protein n=1 Tax=Actinomadura TaxID=1988 RepID=UPI0003F58A03|nr:MULTISPECIES: dTDP-4-dehydrorhamnose 3,5-epimerase [Actinomadura]RSN72157.1 dTDP-4-keto-6-deoxy-D-glucose epimerase [Actinomadura sp. WAC 06369]
MDIAPMSIEGAYRITPEHKGDNRGRFYEAFRWSAFEERVGRPFRVAQVNYSVSRRGTVRGVHGTVVPPGQEKIVSCVRGRVMDIAVDLRVGSPTFGCHDVVHQEEGSGVSVYFADGIGHAFLALTDDACMSYLCSREYVPGTMIMIDPLDPDLALPWKLPGPPIMSAKDRAAPTLAEAAAKDMLPTYEECRRYYAGSTA